MTEQTHDLSWQLEQRRLITENMLDYCEYVDGNEPVLLATNVFAPDGVFELGSTHSVRGRDNLAKMFSRALAAFSATSHHLSNVKISFDGPNRATSSAYVYAWHRTVAGQRAEVWGRYHDQHILLQEGWRIAVRHLLAAGADGWDGPAFELIKRKPNPENPPSPGIERR